MSRSPPARNESIACAAAPTPRTRSTTRCRISSRPSARSAWRPTRWFRPAALAQTATRIAEELDRAGRAVETVRHGCVLLGVESGRPRELEGETSIKRGYLNLLHAREALASLAEGLRQGRAEAGGWYSHRPKAG